MAFLAISSYALVNGFVWKAASSFCSCLRTAALAWRTLSWKDFPSASPERKPAMKSICVRAAPTRPPLATSAAMLMPLTSPWAYSTSAWCSPFSITLMVCPVFQSVSSQPTVVLPSTCTIRDGV